MPVDLTAHFAGAGFNLAVAYLIVRLIYCSSTRDKQYVLTFMTFSTVTYFVLGLLTSVNLSIGVGFGLFAIFSILRYRTATITAREMTYLFVLIALAVMNSVLASGGGVGRMLLSNGVVAALLFAVERGWGFNVETSQRILYDRVDLAAPARRDELLLDLRRRTGLPVRRVQVGRLDLIRDTADITVYFDNDDLARDAPAEGQPAGPPGQT